LSKSNAAAKIQTGSEVFGWNQDESKKLFLKITAFFDAR
jgi:hypothetical protein